MTRHRAKKSLGQNFLVDANQQRRIVEAVGAGPADTVLEIGPGQGALTRHLAGSVGRLIIVELDNDLAAAMQAEYAGHDDVRVVHADFMDVRLQDLTDDVGRLIVVGNIPYNITTPIIFRLLERDNRPRRIVLMIQKEVADRIVAPPGAGSYGALSVGVRTVARVERLFTVPRRSFRPVPGVDSAVIRIEPFSPPRLSAAEDADVRELTRTAFSWRRKQLQKTLRAAPGYELASGAVDQVAAEAGIAATARPEELAPEQFVALARALRRRSRPLADGGA
ncbi:MAG TPA: 16S rRNA (adenine(1518)-N(6)/adenine(1519)-N(6))-dimethyltransferase RsmA [Longimicrobiales bacterium]|nr:16S rRNA (adenine(1518)-N(6)/adenine(1519)-N(6))-dimethyltransferase RsmA [Longimicrobiales bacterium]